MKRTPVGAALRFLLTMPLDLLAVGCRVPVRTKTLLLVHLHHIGDYVLVRNFVRTMKSHERYGDYRITLCANEEIRPLVESFDSDCFSDCIWVERKKLLNNLPYRFTLLREIRCRGFEIAVQPAFSREFYFGDAIVRATGAVERIGSSGGTSNIPLWQKRISDGFYTHLLPTSPGVKFEFLRNKEFFEALLGQLLPITCPSFDGGSVPLPEEIDRPYAVVFPGASVPAKRWKPEGFAEVTRHLASRYGLAVVLAGAPAERILAARVRELAPGIDLVDMSGRTSLAQLAGYLSRARLLVSNDTVAVHLAVSVGTPVVYLLTGAHYGRFGPYPAEVFTRTQALYPPGFKHAESVTRTGGAEQTSDITTIPVEEVIMAVDTLLAP